MAESKIKVGFSFCFDVSALRNAGQTFFCPSGNFHPFNTGNPLKKLNGQRSTVKSQWSKVNAQPLTPETFL
jgi:hypothetical protein